jgi:hypothetical protein
VKNTKSKDDAESEELTFDLVQVVIPGLPDADGIVDPGGVRGAVAVWRGPGVAAPDDGERPAESIGHQRARALYGILQRTSEGLTRTQMLEQARAMTGLFGVSPNNAKVATYRAFDLLIERGLVLRLASGGERYRVVERERHGPDGVLTPNAGDWAVPEPSGWNLWQPIQDRKPTTEGSQKRGTSPGT